MRRTGVLRGSMTTAQLQRGKRITDAAGRVLTPDTFDGTVSADPAFESLGAAEKKGRLGRFTYEFACMNTVGRNRRVYPTEVWKPAAALCDAECKRGRVYGRLDHPPIWSEDAGIPTTRDAAVRVVSIEALDSTKARVIFDVMDNPDGQRLMSIKAAGGDPCISQRAWGDWDQATDPEKAQYGVPTDENLVIARGLRLITFDVVSQPGFDEAGDALVTESNQEGSEPMFKTPAELRAANPELYALIAAEGKATVDVGKLTTEAVAQAKPGIVEEAVKPLNTTVAEKDLVIKGLRDAFETIKPALIKLGVPFESVSDKDLLARLDKANGEKLTLTNENAALKGRADEAERKLREREEKDASEAALAPVTAKYGKGKFAEQIIGAARGKKTEKEALEAAAVEVARIKAIQTASGLTVSTDEAFEGKTSANPADPNGTNDGKPAPTGESRQRVQVGRAMFGG